MVWFKYKDSSWLVFVYAVPAHRLYVFFSTKHTLASKSSSLKASILYEFYNCLVLSVMLFVYNDPIASS